MKVHYLKRLAACLLLATLTSCAHYSETYRDPNMDFSSVKTVAVMPFGQCTISGVAMPPSWTQCL